MDSKVVTSAERRPPNAGKGRQRGVPNKTTTLLKEAILLAGEQHGEDGNGKGGLVGYCRHLAAEEPRAFATLLGKVLPIQVNTSREEKRCATDWTTAELVAFLNEGQGSTGGKSTKGPLQ